MTSKDVESLKRYVQDGGVVLVDACGGGGGASSAFVESIRARWRRRFRTRGSSAFPSRTRCSTPAGRA